MDVSHHDIAVAADVAEEQCSMSSVGVKPYLYLAYSCTHYNSHHGSVCSLLFAALMLSAKYQACL